MRLATFRTATRVWVAAVIPILIACSFQPASAQPSENLKLWYDEAAGRWEEALPVGNGRIGAMIFGNPRLEEIQLNEETVWAGEPGNNLTPELKEQLPEIRELLFAGEYERAHQLTSEHLPRHAPPDNNYGMPYQTVGSLFLEFPGHEDISDYYRDLDIRNAISTVSYREDGVTYRRKMFTSFTDDVMIVRITADKPGKITFTMGGDSPMERFRVESKASQLILAGRSGDRDNKEGKVEFHTIVEPKVKGGSVVAGDSTVRVKEADVATLYISIGTNFNSYKDLTGNASLRAERSLERALSKSYDKLKSDHTSHYKAVFGRVSLDLGGSPQRKNGLLRGVRQRGTGISTGAAGTVVTPAL